ncbi:MAG: hypothetical protein JW778_05830 [Candidatus Altiarchaeota archaeon]|nr:hypothetical protein [Candidatus Altiarchaeota archaeon]
MEYRALIVSVFVLLSIVAWHFLDGFVLRNYVALIPLLFAIQILLNDFIEVYLYAKLKAVWFRLLIAPGTILHEVSHAVAAKLTGCQITSLSLFRFRSHDGNLGSVEYEQPRDSLSVIRCFVVGFAPFFGCGIVLVALMNFTLEYHSGGFITPALVEANNLSPILDSMYSIVKAFYQQFSYVASKPIVFLLLYLQVCFGLGSAPSSVDFKGVFSSLLRRPLGTIVLLLFLAAVFYLSEYPLTAHYVVLAFRWILFILLVSISLLLSSIPLIYVGANFALLSIRSKLAVLIVSALIYFVTRNPFLVLAAFLLVLFSIRYSWLFIKQG